MERSRMLAALGCAAALAAAGCGLQGKAGGESTAGEEGEVLFKISLQNGPEHPLCQGMEAFGRFLEEETKGAMGLELHYSGELGNQRETASGVQSGVIDGAMLAAGVISDYGCEELKLFNLPYLFDCTEHARAFEKSEAGRALLGRVQESGSHMVCIGAYQEGARNYFFTSQDVRRPQDMEGLSIRCQEGQVYRDAVTALGAKPYTLAFSELYSALQSGVVDGAEQPVSGFVLNGYAEIAGYYVMDQHEISPNLILFSEACWEQLDGEQRRQIKTAFERSVEVFERISDQKDEAYLEQMEEAGVKVRTVDIGEWKEASRQVIDVYGTGLETLVWQAEHTPYGAK